MPFWVSAPADVSHMVLYVSVISSVGALPSFFIPARPPTPVGPSGATPKLRLRASASAVVRNLELWLVFTAFAVYVGLFNSVSTLLNQILEPYGYSDTEAGLAGAAMILVGLVSSAITSPIVDRTKLFVPAVKLFVPILALSYLAFVWMPATRPSGGLAGPAVVLAIAGAASFSLLPVAV